MDRFRFALYNERCLHIFTLSFRLTHFIRPGSRGVDHLSRVDVQSEFVVEVDYVGFVVSNLFAIDVECKSESDPIYYLQLRFATRIREIHGDNLVAVHGKPFQHYVDKDGGCFDQRFQVKPLVESLQTSLVFQFYPIVRALVSGEEHSLLPLIFICLFLF